MIESQHFDLTCPSCGHVQRESLLVVSTICRGCGEYLKISEGEVQTKPKHETRFASADRPPISHEKEEGPRPKLQEKPEGFGSLLKKFFNKPPIWRETKCPQCREGFKVLEGAESTQCPSCGSYVSLKNYRIHDKWHHQIETGGDVLIERQGIVLRHKVVCRNLTIEGRFSAPADCSGVLTIRNSGKINGEIRCDELRVERGIKLEIHGEIYANSAYIEGNVKARIQCMGTITLAKKAHLQGVAKAAKLVTKSGSKHTGAFELLQ